MATGYTDANGVYIYGEDDNISLFSDLLNLGEESISAVVGDLRADLTTVESSISNKGCILTHTADQAISSGTATRLSFNTEILDTDGFHSTSTNTSRITIPAGLGGLYNVSAYIRWEGGSVTNPLILLTKNGVNQVRSTDPTGTFTPQSISWNLLCNAGDYLEIVVTHGTGSSKSVSTVSANSFPNLDPQSPYFAAIRVKA